VNKTKRAIYAPSLFRLGSGYNCGLSLFSQRGRPYCLLIECSCLSWFPRYVDFICFCHTHLFSAWTRLNADDLVLLWSTSTLFLFEQWVVKIAWLKLLEPFISSMFRLGSGRKLSVLSPKKVANIFFFFHGVFLSFISIATCALLFGVYSNSSKSFSFVSRSGQKYYLNAFLNIILASWSWIVVKSCALTESILGDCVSIVQ
jgi:hypothetical protein